ncbi:MAG TPA: ATP-binding cassette domain-containing protein [Steroidobacteraceae bacterium]|nr:ATP-binding cassette domain-containing protein [Steroidobacteraceae bacterium]
MSGMFPLVVDRVSFAPSGQHVLREASLEIAQGSFTVILGPNGAGKSVLMRIMHGLLAPTSGSVRWGSLDARPKSQAMLFQRPVILRRSVLANVAYGLHVNGVPTREARDRAATVLETVGLLHLAARPARLLSGGEQQRVALARAAALQPRILFLDEPTASLDPTAVRAIEKGIADLHAGGTTVVMITHHLGQARRLGQHIVFLSNGRIEERTLAAVFFRQPQSPAAENFLREELP